MDSRVAFLNELPAWEKSLSRDHSQFVACTATGIRIATVVRWRWQKTMLSGANAIIVDYPSNHLDLETITSLNNGMIRDKGNL